MGDLTPDWSKYDIPVNIHHLDTPQVFTEQLNYIVTRFNWELKLEKCNTRLAECERELALNKFKSGRKFLEKAKEIAQKIPNDRTIDSHLKQIVTKIERLEKKFELTN